jgi:chaperonin GroES
MGDFPRTVDPVPINGGVLVRIIGNSNITSGGLYLPDTAATRPVQGKVEEVSRGYYDPSGVWREHEVQIGDVVIFTWREGFDLVLDDAEYRIIHEKNIVAILKGVNYVDD